MKSICTQKIGLIGLKMADWRPSLFVKNDTICRFSKFHRFLFIIYIHNELKTCGKSSNLSAHTKLGWPGWRWLTGGHLCFWKLELLAKNHNIIVSVHNLHTQWIANLWQIMKSTRVQHFSHIDFCIWPPGGSDMSKNWGKIIISLSLFIIYIHNELQSCSKSWNVSGTTFQ